MVIVYTLVGARWCFWQRKFYCRIIKKYCFEKEVIAVVVVMMRIYGCRASGAHLELLKP